MNHPFIPSVCPHDCPSACALEVERIDENTIGRVRGARDHSYTRGVVCTKVAHYAERVHHPERLSHPLRRTGAKGSGEFEQIGWDEALDSVTTAFQNTTNTFGAESVWPYYYGGTMGQLQRDGINRLTNAMSYSGMKATICTQIAYAGWQAGAGIVKGSDARDIVNSDLIVVWGGNPVATQVNLMKHIAQAKRERGARLVVIDPATTGTAKKADMHLAPKPGTDGALACAVMAELFRLGYADWDYLNRMTDAPAELAEHVKTRTPEWAAAITGVSAESISEFAALYGQTKRSFLRLGIGFSRQRNGAVNVHAVSCLPAITGAWQHPGGGALMGASGLFGLDKTLIEGLDINNDAIRILDMSQIGAVLTGDSVALQGGPPVNAMLIQNTNPMTVAPDLSAVRRGFMRDDLFVCVHEQFMTETALMADIVLPATTFLEHEDLYQSYGQTHLQLAKPVINAFAESRSNHEVIGALAHRLGAKHEGFDLTAQEIITHTLKATRVGRPEIPSYANLEVSHWHDCSGSFKSMNYLDGFAWPDKKFRFKPDWLASGAGVDEMPELPDFWDVIDTTSPDKPFQLITSPARRFLNSSFTQSPRSIRAEGEPKVRVHPNDAVTLGIADTEIVEVGNDRGSVILRAEITDTIRRGVLEIRGIWPSTAFINGVGVNTLVNADPVKPAGGAAFHDTAAWITPKHCRKLSPNRPAADSS